MSSCSEELDDISFVDYVESLRIPYEEIELATNNFTDANLLPIHSPSSSSFPKLNYKGQLQQSDGQLIDIVARKIPEEQDNIVFNELLTSYLLTHKNILPILKISGTDDPIIINKYEVNESLDKHLSYDSNLTWMQRLHICVGVAHALSYIHDYDAESDFSVIHGNVKSSKILLDENWEPKLNCFGFPMFVKKHQLHLTSKYSGTLQYTDPASVNTGCLTHESDVYSFGVVLFEVLFGRIASVKDGDNLYFARSARLSYEEKILGDMIDPDLLKQMNVQSLEIFLETAYSCLQEESSRRPNMAQIVERLEASLKLQQNGGSDLLFSVSHITSEIRNSFSRVLNNMITICIRVVQNFGWIKISVMSVPSNDFAHLKIPLEVILSATNNFADEKIIGDAGFGNAYRGQLLWSGELIDIDARRLDKKRDDEIEQQFWIEIFMLSTLKHKNLVSLVGFCDDNDEKIIITRRETRGSLSRYLDDPMMLTWVRRLEISVGVAHALSYIHYDESRDFSVIHRNISSSTVLLNDDLEPKLGDFICSMKIKASERYNSFNTDKVSNADGYTDPTYIKTKSANHKTDMYSFGIVMFELLCGRRSVIEGDQDNKYLASVAVAHYREKKLNEIIDWELFNQMDSQSFNIFAKTAYNCLNEEGSQRPNINEIVTRLEKALELQLEHQNAEHSSTVVPSSDRLELKLKQLEHMRIKLEDIKSATNNFASEYCIMPGGFGMVYKTELEHVNREYCKAIEGENVQVPMRRSEVAVKRIYNKEESGEQGFYAEIDMLTSCKHVNIVTLFGFCNEESEMILVYEYASNGSLADYLEGKSNTTKDSWVQRMKISLQVANGLSYLHTSEGDRKEIVHRDINSANILLDENLDAKIGDFGLCKYLYSENEEHKTLYSRKIAGTKVYMDPQYAKEGKLRKELDIELDRKELDIYCLGVVMCEMLCGRLAYDRFFLSRNNPRIVPTARLHFLKGTVEEFVDKRMKEGNREQPFISITRLSSFKTFSQITFRCLAEAQADRPTLECVIKELKESLPFQVLFDKAMELKSRKSRRSRPVF